MTMTTLNTRQAQLEQHHGGCGHEAAARTLANHNRYHDADFWDFWQVIEAQQNARHSPLSILDVGCGPGAFLADLAKRLPDARLTGIELADYMLSAQVSLPASVTIRQDDLNNPQVMLAAGSQHIIMANMLLHELVQPVRLLQCCRHWLAPEGELVVIDMVRQPLASYLPHALKGDTLANIQDPDRLEYQFTQFQEHNRYSADDLVWLLEQTGFTLKQQQSIRSGRAIRLRAG